MPNFSVKFSYELQEVKYYKTAVVRATSPDVAKDKIVNYYLKHIGPVAGFSFEKISLSNYNLILV